MVVDIALGLAEQGLSFVLEHVGLAGTVSAAAVISIVTYLWWGFKAKVLLDVLLSIGATVAKHALVSSVVFVVGLAALIWSGIIPGVDVDAAVQLLRGVLP